ncbi:MAG: tetratricopeptide repeat protein [bacterium]|nr:tetratricopeptide repeat protein [bacterium]
MRSRHWVGTEVVLVLLAVCAPALGTVAGLDQGEGPASAVFVVPRPDLSAMQKSPRERIETLQTSIEMALAAGDRDSRELLEAFGFLGLLFHSASMRDAAEICYQNARTLAPDDGRWSYYLGLVLNTKGDLEGAVASYRESIRLEPERTATRIRLGEVLLELGRLEEARVYFETVERMESDTEAAMFGLGRVAGFEGDHERAVELFEAVLEKQPEASAVHYPLAQAYRGLGQADKAKQHLEMRGDRRVYFSDPLGDMLVLTGKNAALQVVGDLAAESDFSEDSFLGFVLSQFGEVAGAAEQLEKVLEYLEQSGTATQTQLARVHYAAGTLFGGQGQDESAILHLEHAVEGDPGLRDARVRLGNALARSLRFEEALKQFDRALETRADDPEVLARRASVLVSHGRLEDARADLLRAVELDPANPRGWRLLAGVEERLGEGESAAARLTHAIELATEDEVRMPLHKELGDLYYREQRPDESAREYLKALRIDEGYVPALERLAALLGQLREYDAAAQTYNKWIVREPMRIEPRVGEATALILGGRLAMARDRLEAGLVDLPDNLDLKDILARHLAASPDPAVRDGERALELALELYEQVPTPQSIETLAMAHAEAGAFDQAVTWQKRLIDGADEEVSLAQLDLWRRNLARYENRLTCCSLPTP